MLARAEGEGKILKCAHTHSKKTLPEDVGGVRFTREEEQREEAERES